MKTKFITIFFSCLLAASFLFMGFNRFISPDYILKIDNETGEKVELTEFKDRIICSATLDNNFIYVAALLRDNNDFVIYKYNLDKLDENSMETHLNDDKTNISLKDSLKNTSELRVTSCKVITSKFPFFKKED